MRSLLFAVVACLVSTHALRAAEGYRGPIIDVHAHVYASDPRWTYKVPNPVTGQALVATTEAEHRAATLREMEEHGIVRAIVSNDHGAALRFQAAARGRCWCLTRSTISPRSISISCVASTRRGG